MDAAQAGRVATVVGGGIGGLTAAVALQRVGWRVTVLERAPEFGEIGAGLLLMSNALRSLDALGLGAAVRGGGLPEFPGGLRTASGRWLSRIDGAFEQRLGTAALVVHRAELHRILRAALPAEHLLTGATVEAVTAGERGRVEVRYVRQGNPAGLETDLLVAADGLNSRVRAQLWPDAPSPVYAGSTAWRAVTRSALPAGLEMSQTWGEGQEFGNLPLTDGRVYWYGAATTPEGQRCPDELAEVVRRFGAWHDPIPALLAATAPEAVLRHDVYQLATPLPSYVRGRVALLGDAAHAMTPNLGQGAAQAIEDAVVLAAACAAEPHLEAALARYDRERRPRTQAISRAAHLMGRFGQQLEHPVAVALRNTAIRLTPARVALRSMARFGDWTPPPLPGAADHRGSR